MKARLLHVLELSTGHIRVANTFGWESHLKISLQPKFSWQKYFLGKLQINQTGFQSTEKTIWDPSGVFENIRSLGAPSQWTGIFRDCHEGTDAAVAVH